MFSKKGNSLLVAFVFFLIGAAVSYIFSQYQYLDIKKELSVVDTLLSIGTIGIGLYIAFVLDKNKVKSQNLYTYIEKKYDSLWEEFIQFSQVLELSRNIEISQTSKQFKSISKKISPLIKVVEYFGNDCSCLVALESKIDELESYISNNSNIENNIIDLSANREELDQKLIQVNELFAQTFKDLTDV
jgi:hypothetical protein